MAGIAFVVSYGLNSEISILFLSIYVMFTAVSPQMLVLRVVEGRAWKQNQMTDTSATLNITNSSRGQANASSQYVSGSTKDDGIMVRLETTRKTDRSVEDLGKFSSSGDKAKRLAAKQPGLSHGLVQRLAPEFKILRGTTSKQTPLWPPGVTDLTELVLRGVKYTSRSVILNFGHLWMQLQYYLHTSIQVYSPEMWHALCQVPISVRIFRVGMAIVFEHCVIAVPSRDQVFQVKWATSEALLPYREVNVLSQWQEFLAFVTAWLRAGLDKIPRRSKLFIDSMRDSKGFLPGVGVYSACEILYLAGVSPYATECEVLLTPSMLARVLEAYFVYAHTATEIWEKLLRFSVREGIQAPTPRERRTYASWLNVYAKSRVFISARAARLLASQRSATQYDVFEPTYLKLGLEQNDHLGMLVFGEEKWATIRRMDIESVRRSAAQNPLYRFYKEKGLLTSDTHLLLDEYAYDNLFLTRAAMRATSVPTVFCRGTKQMWSIIPLPPGAKAATKEIQEIKGLEKERKTFLYILASSKDVVIGPLEYCGNGVLVKTARNVIHAVLPCQGAADGNISPYFVHRAILNNERKSRLGREAGIKDTVTGTKRKIAATRLSREMRKKAQDKITIMRGIQERLRKEKEKNETLHNDSMGPSTVCAVVSAATTLPAAASAPLSLPLPADQLSANADNTDKENVAVLPVNPPRKRKRHSADRDLVDVVVADNAGPSKRVRTSRGIEMRQTEHPIDAILATLPQARRQHKRRRY
ncbi:hypothetical protein FA95DRAFT_1677697 [Auriscalpium vulgare]|uniref:Uncharacterized protein n=1 Tax=Auriscalpium vulgare TaxID=40419 RepID=A0ACB8RYP3_9AGAM|nr:hypothetical protein FA95DRAFT_1677697 [Auriscalpium vulgare]